MAEYIEREAVLKLLEDEARCGYLDAADINGIPAADVAPVVHGRWVKTEQENGCAEWTEFKCSVCGAVFDGNDGLFNEWKGCPMCLATMDLEGGNT